jgi:hypothetical protein
MRREYRQIKSNQLESNQINWNQIKEIGIEERKKLKARAQVRTQHTSVARQVLAASVPLLCCVGVTERAKDQDAQQAQGHHNKTAC